MVGQPAHAEDGDHATKHLHYLKIVKMKLEDDEKATKHFDYLTRVEVKDATNHLDCKVILKK